MRVTPSTSRTKKNQTQSIVEMFLIFRRLFSLLSLARYRKLLISNSCWELKICLYQINQDKHHEVDSSERGQRVKSKRKI